MNWIIILQAGIATGTVLLFATLGEILAERSGVLNLGVEGMMALGAVASFAVAMTTGNPWLALLVAVVVGAAAAAIHALVSVGFKANQVVSGLALTMLGLGVSGLFGRPYIGR